MLPIVKISPDRGHPTHEGRFHPIGRGRLFAIGRFASSVTSVVAELFARDAPAITGDAFPALIGARRTSLHQRGSIAPAREHDARGNSGGFAPLETSCRRVAGVSRLYWCNSPRLLAPSTWGGLDRAPLMVQFPSPCPGMKGAAPKPQAPRRPRAPKPPPPRHNGGFCTIRSILPACRRRVAPLMLQIPPFAGSEIAVRGGEIAVRGGEVPTSPATSATNADNGASCPGCRGRGGLRCRHNGTWPRASLAHEPAIASTSLLFRT